MLEVDALIIGAGPAGTSCALGLVKRGWQVVIIEKSVFPRHKTCGGFIGPENESFLSELGVWPRLIEQGACVVEESFLSSSKGASTFIPIDGVALGVSRKLLDQLLLDCARSLGVKVLEGAQTRDLYKESQGYLISVDHYQENRQIKVRARHVIDASGQHSPSVNVTRFQLGIAAMFQGIPRSYKRVMLHCCKGGHVGINPFENDQVNICYVVDSKYFKKHGQDPEAVFKGWVKNSPHLQQVMVASSRITPWKAVKIPVRDSVVHYEKGIWRAGNSAAFIDTATGGGITVALQSGQILAKALASNANDEDILRVYDSEYRRHFSGQRRLAALFGSMIHYPWAADTIIRLLDLNNKMGQSVMNYSRPGFQLARGFK